MSRPPSEPTRYQELPHPAGLLTRVEIAARAEQLRGDGRRLVFTNGCFDLLHPGHVIYLAAARERGDLLVVGLNSDASVSRLKGPHRPLQSELARATLLLALTSVDLVSIFDEDTPLELIRAVRPHVLIKGGDYRPEAIIGRAEVESWGGVTEVIPFVTGYSTSDLEQRLRAGGSC